MAKDESSPKHLDIRKYPNRRYYDNTRSRHVTLEQIHAAIRDGYDIHVTDSKSGVDITPKVLAQIILELDPPKLEIFPTPLLHRLIRANEQIVTDFVDKYFNKALAAFMNSQQQFESYLREAMYLRPGTAPPSDWMRTMMGPLAQSFWPAPARNQPETPPASTEVATGQQQADLRAELEDLRKQLAALKNKGPRGRRR